MEKQTWNAVRAIHNLVSELKGAFPRDKPLCMYDRLLCRITIDNVKAAEAQVATFRKFYEKYGKSLIDAKAFPVGTRITLYDRVYIDLARLMAGLSIPDQKNIRQHLLTIYAILEPKSMAMSKLEKKIDGLDIDDSSEGDFIKDIFSNIQSAASESGDTEDPMALMGALSTLVPKIMTQMSTGVTSGQLDVKKIFATMSGVINTLSGEDEVKVEEESPPETEQDKPSEEPKVEEID